MDGIISKSTLKAGTTDQVDYYINECKTIAVGVRHRYYGLDKTMEVKWSV